MIDCKWYATDINRFPISLVKGWDWYYLQILCIAILLSDRALVTELYFKIIWLKVIPIFLSKYAMQINLGSEITNKTIKIWLKIICTEKHNSNVHVYDTKYLEQSSDIIKIIHEFTSGPMSKIYLVPKMIARKLFW